MESWKTRLSISMGEEDWRWGDGGGSEEMRLLSDMAEWSDHSDRDERDKRSDGRRWSTRRRSASPKGALEANGEPGMIL